MPRPLLASIVLLAAVGFGASGAALREIDVPPRTPLYCADGRKPIQPMIYGDFGDLVSAYRRLHGMPGKVVSADGESARLVFTSADDDPRSPGEVVSYDIFRHADGWAVRSASDTPRGSPPQTLEGLDLCILVLTMFVDSDPDRARQYRREWGEKHPDSTSR